MPYCPYTTHQDLKEIGFNGQSVAFCRESCLRTSFSCSHCGEGNRTLSRFCRQCGNRVSYTSTEADFERSLHFVGHPGDGVNYSLSSHAVKEVYALKSHLGFLVVVGNNCVLLFDVNRLHEPLKRFEPADGRDIRRGVTPVSLPDDEQLVVTTARSLYRFSLVNNDSTGELIYKTTSPSAFILYPALHMAGSIYFLEYSEVENSSRLICFPEHVVATVKGRSQRPILIGEDQIFFCTEEQVFLYNSRTSSLKSNKSPEYLRPNVRPAYSKKLEAIYLVGENRLWRLDLNETELSALPLNTTSVGDPRIAAGEDQLFVSRSNGLVILDPFGDVKWNSMNIFIRAAFDGRPPELYPRHFVFTSIGRLGGSDARVHERANPASFEMVSYAQRLSCPPLLSQGRLIASVGEGSSLQLSINSL